MNPSNHLFVYGTLRLGFSNHYAQLLQKNAIHKGRATINGKLFDVGGYPGIIRSTISHELITGDIFEFPFDSDLMAVLDEYEMCSSTYPEPQEYKREIIKITTNNASIIRCWVYIYNWEISHHTRIQSGDYKKHLQMQS